MMFQKHSSNHSSINPFLSITTEMLPAPTLRVHVHVYHRLQLSRNLRDSPGSLALVPGPTVCPGSKLGSCTMDNKPQVYYPGCTMSRFSLQVIRMSNSTCRTTCYTVRDYEQSYRWTCPIIKKGVVISA